MTKLDILNFALLQCGLPLASSLEDMDYNARFAYDTAVLEALRAHHWSFARAYAILEELPNDGAYGNRHVYRLPQDYVRFIDARPSQDLSSPAARELERAGQLLLCNISPCFLRYTRLENNPENWPADFAKAIAYRVASEIAPLSAERMDLKSPLLQSYSLQLSLAQTADSREHKISIPNVAISRTGK